MGDRKYELWQGLLHVCGCVCVLAALSMPENGNKKDAKCGGWWCCHKLGLQIRRRDVPNYKAKLLARTSVAAEWFAGSHSSTLQFQLAFQRIPLGGAGVSSPLPWPSILLVCAKAAAKMSLRANKFLSEGHKAKALNADEGAAKLRRTRTAFTLVVKILRGITFPVITLSKKFAKFNFKATV